MAGLFDWFFNVFDHAEQAPNYMWGVSPHSRGMGYGFAPPLKQDFTGHQYPFGYRASFHGAEGYQPLRSPWSEYPHADPYANQPGRSSFSISTSILLVLIVLLFIVVFVLISILRTTQVEKRDMERKLEQSINAEQAGQMISEELIQHGLIAPRTQQFSTATTHQTTTMYSASSLQK